MLSGFLYTDPVLFGFGLVKQDVIVKNMLFLMLYKKDK